MANRQLINPSDKNVSHTYAGKDRNVVLKCIENAHTQTKISEVGHVG